jgi:hypothetical protein
MELEQYSRTLGPTEFIAFKKKLTKEKSTNAEQQALHRLKERWRADILRNQQESILCQLRIQDLKEIAELLGWAPKSNSNLEKFC